MCLGDSITLGVGGGGYREPLGALLQQHEGGDWDYVGPMYGNGGKHAGYNGWTIKQILTVAENAMAVHQPTHILLMAGTNDFFCTYYRPAPIPRRLRLRDA
jgi:lysophospholipase L1-like esterase